MRMTVALSIYINLNLKLTTRICLLLIFCVFKCNQFLHNQYVETKSCISSDKEAKSLIWRKHKIKFIYPSLHLMEYEFIKIYWKKISHGQFYRNFKSIDIVWNISFICTSQKCYLIFMDYYTVWVLAKKVWPFEFAQIIE